MVNNNLIAKKIIMIECDEVMKDKIKMILDSLPEEERAELLEMYIPVHEKDIFPVVKKIY
ncbi:hypothetical protein KAU11_09350 [Candidatus Babeliales bacterium]|nr:hypothetical protein [Candidatus Babeliales bacterium]